jgi:hypothetical protein
VTAPKDPVAAVRCGRDVARAALELAGGDRTLAREVIEQTTDGELTDLALLGLDPARCPRCGGELETETECLVETPGRLADGRPFRRIAAAVMCGSCEFCKELN